MERLRSKHWCSQGLETADEVAVTAEETGHVVYAAEGEEAVKYTEATVEAVEDAGSAAEERSASPDQ